MSGRAANHGTLVESSFLARVRDAFTYDVYQDLQEFVFEKFRTPSIILIRLPDDSVRPCFPVERYRGFCDYCRLLRNVTGEQNTLDFCVQNENDFVERGVRAEREGRPWEWGWRQCHAGLWDYYAPIRAQGGGGEILAVLIVGQRREAGDAAAERIRRHVREITTGERSHTYFPGRSLEERQQHATNLLGAIESIPIICDDEKAALEAGVREMTSLVGLIATRSLRSVLFLEGQEFIHKLGLDHANVNVGEHILWEKIEHALDLIVDYLPLTSAVVYVSSPEDYAGLTRRASLPHDEGLPISLGVASAADFRWLRDHNGVRLPQESGPLQWLDPRTYFGAASAFVFGAETITNQFVLVGFGNRPQETLNVLQRAILYDAVYMKIFRFIDNALFGVELDHLMTETGHLMGRARGKVVSGVETLRKDFLERPSNPDDEEFLNLAMWAIDDGLMRLELVRQNFYSFRGRRLGIDPDILADDESHSIAPLQIRERSAVRPPIDVVEVLDDLKEHFQRAVAESELRPLRYVKQCSSAFAQCRKTDLRLVFVNLFDNAMKFAYNGTYIEIRARTEKVHEAGTQEECVIQFSNLGVGVPSDEWNRVFERFQRSRFRDKSRRIEGLGLGLAYCRRVIEQEFGGKISLESREAHTPRSRRFDGDNWTTTVTVRLPLCSSFTQETSSAAHHLL